MLPYMAKFSASVTRRDNIKSLWTETFT